MASKKTHRNGGASESATSKKNGVTHNSQPAPLVQEVGRSQNQELNETQRKLLEEKLIVIGIDKAELLKYAEIVYVDTANGNSIFHSLEVLKLPDKQGNTIIKRVIISSYRLKFYESRLKEHGFYRPDQSIIVNLNHLRTVVTQEPALRFYGFRDDEGVEITKIGCSNLLTMLEALAKQATNKQPS